MFSLVKIQHLLFEGIHICSSRQVKNYTSRFRLGWLSQDPLGAYCNVNTPGSGAGRGGGGGGSVRESGGGLGQYGAAHEEEYFYNKRREQLEKIKSKMKEELKSPKISQKEEK